MNDSKGSKPSKDDFTLRETSCKTYSNKLPLKELYTFVSHFLKRVGPNRQAKKRGRPPKYGGTLILTLWQEKQPLPAHCF
jgi:hypothetical protein